MTPNQVTVFRKFSPEKDTTGVKYPFATPKREWVVAVHTWATGWQELVFGSMHEARAFAYREGASFENALHTKKRS